MLALKNYRVDVVAQYQEDGSRLYVESLKMNLREYGVEDRVKFVSSMDLLVYYFKQFGLVVGSHKIFDDYIYPELLEQAVTEGSVELIHNLLHDYLSHTHLVLFYDEQMKD